MGFTMMEGSFEVLDYVLFIILCLASCAGGFYYSYTQSKKQTVKDTKDYLLGGKTMKTFPVGMSLIASYVSALTILGTPSEIYNYGSQYILVVVAVCFSCVCVAFVYVPVFYTLQLSSSYEYLELRFNRHVRAVASILFLLDEILFLPMVIYVPALAFYQLTGYNVYIVGGVMVLICGIYTVLGGLRAVVWTDMWQTILMYVGVVAVAIAGTIELGLGEIIDISKNTNRLDMNNWSFDPHERQTAWGALVGGFIYWTCFNSVNQTMVQKYIALPSMRKIYYALGIFCFGGVVTIVLCVWCGVSAWAAWVSGGCHPGGVPLVDDRLLPAFVTYVSKVHRIPGLAGLFLAGIFGAGLSSLSAILNACALVVVEDLMHGWLRITLDPYTEGVVARIVSAVLAVLSVVMVVVIRKLGGILGVGIALSAIAASATCGIFTLGMVCWWVGPRGAIAGGIAGAIVAGSISLGIQTASAKGYRWSPPGMTEQCEKNSTFDRIQTEVDPSTIFWLFRVSFHWIAAFGLFATIIVGALVGCCERRSDVDYDAELFTPLVNRCLPLAAHDNAGNTRRAHVARFANTVEARADARAAGADEKKARADLKKAGADAKKAGADAKKAGAAAVVAASSAVAMTSSADRKEEPAEEEDLLSVTGSTTIFEHGIVWRRRCC